MRSLAVPPRRLVEALQQHFSPSPLPASPLLDQGRVGRVADGAAAPMLGGEAGGAGGRQLHHSLSAPTQAGWRMAAAASAFSEAAQH